jgi:CDP-paratose 2-epimerase
MGIAIVTGSAGLVGAAAVRCFAEQGLGVVGVDNDMRSNFFGAEASTDWSRRKLIAEVHGYEHWAIDIRDADKIQRLFKRLGSSIEVIVHSAAQPSHDWAVREPFTDFTINAIGTLVLLEAARQHCPNAVFIFMSTNKVYGDSPNSWPLVETERRWELQPDHPYFTCGVDESLSIDQSKHTLFGASKVAADILVQEYGRYFGMRTGVFRAGCITGPGHSGVQLHGFLAYLMKCVVTGAPYTIFGHGGKQVRDNLHSTDLANCFLQFYKNPRAGEVYNIGGGRYSNCSMLEAIDLCERVSGRQLQYAYTDKARIGDHIWWISDVGKFQRHYPEWRVTYDTSGILTELYSNLVTRSRGLDDGKGLIAASG